MHRRLGVRIAVSFLLFMAAGTIGLIFLLTAAFQQVSHGEFLALANANADFIRSEHLPRTPRLASYLSSMLGAEVHFDDAGAPDANHEAVKVSIEPGVEMTLIRERPTLRKALLRPVALGALAAFWALWFALAWAVVRPYLRAERFALLGGMATSLAHEIRNPIAAIRLHGQLLEEKHGENARLIVGEAEKIEDLVNQWMFLARPEPPRKVDVALAELLSQMVRVVTPSAEHAQVKITLDATAAQHRQADAQRLGQVFHNIMINAIQAMPSGGTLAITARDGTISFADTGSGFSQTALKRWAEMLYSEKEGGMGIGLSVAREIVYAHNGRITVANRPSGGAIVRIEL